MANTTSLALSSQQTFVRALIRAGYLEPSNGLGEQTLTAKGVQLARTLIAAVVADMRGLTDCTQSEVIERLSVISADDGDILYMSDIVQACTNYPHAYYHQLTQN